MGPVGALAMANTSALTTGVVSRPIYMPNLNQATFICQNITVYAKVLAAGLTT